MANRNIRSQRGFTLVEMMVALAILVFGVCALAGSLLTGVGTRRGNEMRFRADALVNQAVYRIQEEWFAADSDPGTPLKDIVVEDPPGYPGMKYVVQRITDQERPGLVLARIKVSWKEQGEQVGETFERIFVKQTPFSKRVAARLDSR